MSGITKEQVIADKRAKRAVAYQQSLLSSIETQESTTYSLKVEAKQVEVPENTSSGAMLLEPSENGVNLSLYLTRGRPRQRVIRSVVLNGEQEKKEESDSDTDTDVESVKGQIRSTFEPGPLFCKWCSEHHL